MTRAHFKEIRNTFTKKISKQKQKTKHCKRNMAKLWRYRQVRAAINRKLKGSAPALKKMTAAQKRAIGSKSHYSKFNISF